MKRSAKEGLICITNSNDASSIIEINSETDFVAKNDEYIKFCEELSKINFSKKGNINEAEKRYKIILIFSLIILIIIFFIDNY